MDVDDDTAGRQVYHSLSAELRLHVAGAGDDLYILLGFFVVDSLAPFNSAHCRILLCNIVVLLFWVSVALNFNCLGAREEGLIFLGNGNDDLMDCALRWKSVFRLWLNRWK